MSHPLWTLYNSETEQMIENLDIQGAVTSLSSYSIEQLAVWFAWHEGLTDWKPILELPEFQALNEETVTSFVSEVTNSVEVRAPADDAGHIFWMAEGDDATPIPTSIDEITATREYPVLEPVPLPAESEHLAAQAESMPEHESDSYAAPVETPQRQASFPLGSGSAPVDQNSNQQPTSQDRRKHPRFDIRYRVIVRNDNLTFRTFSRNVSLGGLALEMPVPEALLGSECQIYVGNPKTGENIRFSGKLVANRTDSQYFVFLKSSPDSLSKLQKWVESHQTAAKRAV